jgi:hypothetical protein
MSINIQVLRDGQPTSQDWTTELLQCLADWVMKQRDLEGEPSIRSLSGVTDMNLVTGETPVTEQVCLPYVDYWHERINDPEDPRIVKKIYGNNYILSEIKTITLFPGDVIRIWFGHGSYVNDEPA